MYMYTGYCNLYYLMECMLFSHHCHTTNSVKDVASCYNALKHFLCARLAYMPQFYEMVMK